MSALQTALVPDTRALTKLSKCLVESRNNKYIAFPGTPQSSDLSVLDTNPQNALTVEDVTMLKELKADLEAVCQHASERNVKVIIDAEHR
jgi:proline dehydrogenase